MLVLVFKALKSHYILFTHFKNNLGVKGLQGNYVALRVAVNYECHKYAQCIKKLYTLVPNIVIQSFDISSWVTACKSQPGPLINT